MVKRLHEETVYYIRFLVSAVREVFLIITVMVTDIKSRCYHIKTTALIHLDKEKVEMKINYEHESRFQGSLNNPSLLDLL